MSRLDDNAKLCFTTNAQLRVRYAELASSLYFNYLGAASYEQLRHLLFLPT
jgi:hypothetical protein